MMEASSGSAWVSAFNTGYTILQPFIWSALLAIATLALGEMKRRGYHTTYAAAIVRAAGAGVMAAKTKGLDPFEGQGRMVAMRAGVDYLLETVNDSARSLGLVVADHEDRVIAQLGVLSAQGVGSLLTEVTSQTEPEPIGRTSLT